MSSIVDYNNCYVFPIYLYNLVKYIMELIHFLRFKSHKITRLIIYCYKNSIPFIILVLIVHEKRALCRLLFIYIIYDINMINIKTPINKIYTV